MTKLSFLFLDSGGLHCDTARQLGKEGHTVWYFNPYHSAYVEFPDYAPGVGVPEIQKVDDYGPYVDQADCIVFPDVGMGGLANYFREKGYNVFGAGNAEVLEQDRPKAVKILNQLGLKTPKTHVVNGIPAALDFFKKAYSSKLETNQNATGNYFVKFNVFRGTIDSFPVKSLKDAKFMFGNTQSAFGPFANSIPITIQESVDGIESGMDLFFNGEEFIGPFMWGFESCGNYLGYMQDDLGIYEDDLRKLAKLLRQSNYRGAFSFETITDDDMNHYWIDPTTRFPMPLGLMYCTFMPDFGEFIHALSCGSAERNHLPLNQYLGCMEVNSESADKQFIPIQGGPNTRFMRFMMDGDQMYSVPGTCLLGMCGAMGSTINDVQESLNEEKEHLNVFFGKYDPRFILDVQTKYMEPFKQKGVQFGLGDRLDESLLKPRKKKPISDGRIKLDRFGIPL